MSLALPPPYRPLRFDEIDSTSDEAKRRAEAGAEHGTLIWATAQRKGRGRRGNVWSSPPGNLYMSLILRPERTPAEALQLSFVAALALSDAIGVFVPGDVTCKWPNDVFLDHRKVAGLLLESSSTAAGNLDWLVIGAGVNLISAPQDIERPATSLAAVGGDTPSAEQLITAFCTGLLARYEQWLAQGFAPQRRDWLARAEGRDGPVTVNLEGETFAGRFIDIDETGALVVDTGGAHHRLVTSGEVFMS